MKIELSFDVSDKFKEVYEKNKDAIISNIKVYLKNHYVPKDEKMIELYEYMRDILVEQTDLGWILPLKEDSGLFLGKTKSNPVKLRYYGDIMIVRKEGGYEVPALYITRRQNGYKNYDYILVDDKKIDEIIKEGRF